ncbi:MAG: hypothetical protein IJU44_05130 [Kiritimatiellae bacterium]|nr:hypothetical protein [Kiritimatiellia bacterium]
MVKFRASWKVFPLFCGMLAGLYATTASGVISHDAVERLKSSVPVAFYGFPNGRILKANPVASEKQRMRDRRVTVDLKVDQLVLLQFSDDEKCVELVYPLPKNKSQFTNGWFMAEDVLNIGKDVPSDVTSTGNLFLYSPYGERRPTLIGCVDKGEPYASFGKRKVGREEFVLALADGGGREVFGYRLAGRLAYARDQGPLDDESTYPDRVDSLLAEEPYQPGRHWDNSTHPLLVRSGNGGCAAFVTDFAKYLFGAGNFDRGERYTDASEIRAGDVLALKGHFMAVLYRDGEKLSMIDGNCNSSIRRTATTYTVVKGKWCDGGRPVPENFICGYHYLKEPPVMRNGKPARKKKAADLPGKE